MKTFLSPTRVLRFGLFAMVFSRGFLYLFFSTPYRSLFWNESLFSPVVINIFGMSWKDYANTSDPWISVLDNLIGLALMLSSFIFLAIKNNTQKWQAFAIKIVGFITLLHMVLIYMGHNHELPLLPEYMLQALAPWLFLAFLPYFPKDENAQWSTPSPEVHFWTRLAISACFIGHGLYAFGIPYQPASFVRLLNTITSIEYDTAAVIVRIIGMVDIVLGVTVLIRPLEKLSLRRMAVWGFATALARVTAFVVIPMNLGNLNPWFFETTVRLIHGAMPLFLLMLLKRDIIPIDRHFSPDLKSWIRRWQFAPTSVILAMLILAELSTVHSFTDVPQVELAEKMALKMAPPDAERPSAGEEIEIRRSHFRESAEGYHYSDTLFRNNTIPTRLKLDSAPGDLTLRHLEKFVTSRSAILDGLKAHIVAQFNSSQGNHSFSTDDILRFTEKVVIIYDNGDVLQAEIHVPWATGKVLTAEVDVNGAVIDLTLPEKRSQSATNVEIVNARPRKDLKLPLETHDEK